MKKLIFFELNEVPWSVIDHYCQKLPDSVLAQTLPLCSQYETITDDVGHLSPWITWPTIHRGVHNVMHKIQDFGQDLSAADAQYPPIWKILHQNAVRTGVFASMHSYPPPPDFKTYAFYVPDPFAGESIVHPEKLRTFQDFNLRMSRKSARNVDSGIDWKGATALAGDLFGIGIKPQTLSSVAMQLLRERMKPWIRTRRRSYQSILAFDVFMKLLKDEKPDFATFLSNHLASTMHRYWAAAFPEHYDAYELSDEWQATYRHEITFAMQVFDDFLERLVDFVRKNPEYQLLITSSMGQKATEAKLILTETACKNLEKLMQFLEIPETDWERQPAMHPQYNFRIAENQVKAATEKLSQIQIGGKALRFRQKADGFFSIDLGHRNLDPIHSTYQGKPIDPAALGIHNEAVEDQTGSTAYHIKEGSFLVFDTAGRKENKRLQLSSRAVVPSILENFKIPVPEYMVSERLTAIG